MTFLDHQNLDIDIDPRSSDNPQSGGACHTAAACPGRGPPEPTDPEGPCGPVSGEYVINISMPTSVHIPKQLLEAVDRRARALRISRNHLIVLALEREMKQTAAWSPGFFERLVEVDEPTSKAVDDLMAAVRTGRRSKEPQQL